MRKKSEICLDSMTAVKTQINLCCKQQYEVAPQNEMEVMEAQQSDGTSAVCKLTKIVSTCLILACCSSVRCSVSSVFSLTLRNKKIIIT